LSIRKIVILASIILPIAWTVVGCRTTSTTLTATIENTPLPSTPSKEGSIDVGGYKLRYQCFGEGTPAAIVEAGGGDKPTITMTWSMVIQNVYPITRICIYDHVNGIRTSQDIAEDLHVLLSKIPVTGPYILIAHSIGGYHARVFAHNYPKDVAGMILVDTTPLYPDANIAFATAYPTYSTDEAPGLTDGRISTSDIYTIMPLSVDGLDFEASAEQVRQAGSLGDIPLIVISQTPGGPDDWPGLDPTTRELYAAIILKIQADMAKLSSAGIFRVAKTSEHFISLYEPEIIIDAITQMVKEIRNKGYK